MASPVTCLSRVPTQRAMSSFSPPWRVCLESRVSCVSAQIGFTFPSAVASRGRVQCSGSLYASLAVRSLGSCCVPAATEESHALSSYVERRTGERAAGRFAGELSRSLSHMSYTPPNQAAGNPAIALWLQASSGWLSLGRPVASRCSCAGGADEGSRWADPPVFSRKDFRAPEERMTPGSAIFHAPLRGAQPSAYFSGGCDRGRSTHRLPSRAPSVRELDVPSRIFGMARNSPFS
jgi:hypothetical protein